MSPALNEEKYLRNSSSSCINLQSLYRENSACYNRVPLVSKSIRQETAIPFAKASLVYILKTTRATNETHSKQS